MLPRDIIGLIDAVDQTAATIAAVAVKMSSTAPNDLVRARRTISTQIQDMNRTIDDVLITPLMKLGTPPAAELRRCYLERSSHARTAMADHQAKWPAMEMRAALVRYREDVSRLHADQRAYRRWLKMELVPQAAALLS